MEGKEEVLSYFLYKKTEWYLEDNKLPLFVDSMPQNPKILDVVCGNGILVRKLSELGFKDIHMADIDNYLSFGDAERLGVFSKVDLTYEKLPYFDGEFDVVFATMVLEHLENPWHFGREVDRVLKSGGKLILAIPNSYNLYNRLRFLKSCDLERFTMENNHTTFLTNTCFKKCFLRSFSIEKVDYSVPQIKIFGRKLRKLKLPRTEWWGKYFSANVCYILKKKLL